jgi:hypothetical protein
LGFFQLPLQPFILPTQPLLFLFQPFSFLLQPLSFLLQSFPVTLQAFALFFPSFLLPSQSVILSPELIDLLAGSARLPLARNDPLLPLTYLGNGTEGHAISCAFELTVAKCKEFVQP